MTPSEDPGAAEVRACARCGELVGDAPGGLPAGWSLASDRRGTLFLCGVCTRTNLRAIEGKLDEGWWEG